MAVVTVQRDGLAERLVAPATALVMLAVQVGSNATLRRPFLLLLSRHGAALVRCTGRAGLVPRGPGDERPVPHVFDLLALAYDRGVRTIARRAHETGNAHGRGMALAYLEGTCRERCSRNWNGGWRGSQRRGTPGVDAVSAHRG